MDAGAVYVFTRSGSTWSQQAKLTRSDAQLQDRVGQALAISGDTVVIGAELDDEAGQYSGSAAVFTRTGSTWTEQAKLIASDAAPGQQLGQDVALSETTALLASPNSESVYAYTVPVEEPVEIAPGVVGVAEGDTGPVNAFVPVTLSEPSFAEVTVDWSTADWTATSPDDFVADSGTLTFAPGETSKTVQITINGDLLYEDDELVGVRFSNPTNATIGGFMGLGVVIIYDDDPQPTVTPGGFVANPEGDTGSTIWNLPVTLPAPAGVQVSINWSTADIPSNPKVAHPGEDFVAASGTVTFAPGETVKNIPIEVLGDTVDEPPLLYGEWGLVTFSNPVNTSVTGGFFGAGLFIIIDDD